MCHSESRPLLKARWVLLAYKSIQGHSRIDAAAFKMKKEV